MSEPLRLRPGDVYYVTGYDHGRPRFVIACDEPYDFSSEVQQAYVIDHQKTNWRDVPLEGIVIVSRAT